MKILKDYATKYGFNYSDLLKDYYGSSKEERDKFLDHIQSPIIVNEKGYYEEDPRETSEVIVPSRNITMKDIPYEIDAYDARTGKYLERMKPDKEYYFNTDAVLEHPVYAQTGKYLDSLTDEQIDLLKKRYGRYWRNTKVIDMIQYLKSVSDRNIKSNSDRSLGDGFFVDKDGLIYSIQKGEKVLGAPDYIYDRIKEPVKAKGTPTETTKKQNNKRPTSGNNYLTTKDKVSEWNKKWRESGLNPNWDQLSDKEKQDFVFDYYDKDNNLILDEDSPNVATPFRKREGFVDGRIQSETIKLLPINDGKEKEDLFSSLFIPEEIDLQITPPPLSNKEDRALAARIKAANLGSNTLEKDPKKEEKETKKEGKERLDSSLKFQIRDPLNNMLLSNRLANSYEPVDLPYKRDINLQAALQPRYDPSPIINNIFGKFNQVARNINTQSTTGQAVLQNMWVNTIDQIREIENNAAQKNSQIEASNAQIIANINNKQQEIDSNNNYTYLDDIQRSEAARDLIISQNQQAWLNNRELEKNRGLYLDALLLRHPYLNEVEDYNPFSRSFNIDKGLQLLNNKTILDLERENKKE